MEQKLCRVCGKLKDLDNFTKNDKMVDGHRNECKECLNRLYNDKDKIRERNLEKEIKTEGKKICRVCGFDKPLSEYHIKRGTPDGHRHECKECCKDIQKKYKEAPGFKDKQKEYDKKRYEELREKVLQRKKEYHIENREDILKKKSDYRKTSEFKIKNKKWKNENKHTIAWRSILHSTLKRLGTIKQGHTIDLLGYTALDLKQHIESQFTPGMSWKNYGEWEIDHIKQVINFLPTDDVREVCALKNLRPLWETTREIDGIVYEGNLNRVKY